MPDNNNNGDNPDIVKPTSMPTPIKAETINENFSLDVEDKKSDNE